MGNDINFYRRKSKAELDHETWCFKIANEPFTKGDPAIAGAMLARDVEKMNLWVQLGIETSGASQNRKIEQTILPEGYEPYQEHILTKDDIGKVIEGLVTMQTREENYIVQILAAILYYLTQGIDIKVWEN